MSTPTITPASPRATPPTPPAPRRPHEPAIVQPGRNPRARSRVRVQWLALAAALIVLAGTLVAWALSRAAERIQVVSVARPVQAGDLLAVEDLTIADVAIDDGVRGLVPAASLANVAGRVAAIDLSPGMLLTTGMWTDDVELRPDERTVGAVLSPGRFPSGLAHGATAWAIDIRAAGSVDADTTDAAGGAVPPEPVVVRVLDVTVDATGSMVVTLAVPAESAVDIASLAATDTLSLAGIPASAITAEAPTP